MAPGESVTYMRKANRDSRVKESSPEPVADVKSGNKVEKFVVIVWTVEPGRLIAGDKYSRLKR